MRHTLIGGSIRRALLLIVLASVVPALGIILFSGLENRDHALQEARVSALRLAGSMAEVQERGAQNIRLLLSVLAKTPPVLHGDPGAVGELLEDVSATDSTLASLFMARADGTIVAASRPFGAASIADRPYFTQAMASGDFTVGEYQIGRIVNVPVLAFAQPVPDSSGRPRAVLGAAIALDSYAELFGKAQLPRNSVIAVADRHGVRLCRFPVGETAKAGQPLPAELWTAMTASGGQGAAVQTGSDGVRRIYAFTQLALAPGEPPYAHIVVGIPEEESLATAHAALARNLVLLALATLLALFISWTLWKPVLGRRVQSLAAVTARLGSGDLSARVEEPARSGDLGSLERSVNAMAEALAKADEKRRVYEQALRKAGEELELRVLGRTAELRDANRRLKLEMFERGRAEEALRKSERMYRSLYEQAAVGIFVLDMDGGVVDANPAALSMLGYSQQEITRLGYADLIHPACPSSAPMDLEEAASGGTLIAERLLRAKNGEAVPVEAANRRIGSDLLQMVFTDARQRKKLEQLREDVERITRHDLKTPLMSVVHMPNLMLRDANLTPKQRELLEMVRESGYRMLRAINMSLSIYKMETGDYECDNAEFDLLALTRRAAAEAVVLGGAGVRVLLDGAEPGPEDAFPVQGEEPLCLTMLENLLKNAVEASPPDAAVLVLLERGARRLTVTNQGEVPPRIRERFFEKYSTEGKKWGTGLGTYSARLIAATHGWRLTLDCSAPGRTSVTVHLTGEA